MVKFNFGKKTNLFSENSLDHLGEGVGNEGEHENEGDDENDKGGEDLLHILQNDFILKTQPKKCELEIEKLIWIVRKCNLQGDAL